jgi:(R,R)-butanediol dehydrogenase/meso-butanediol dehydrogenase/diacetyl reductase
MKAAIFRGLGKPLSIETVPEPKALPGDVIIRIARCGICGSDLHATQPGEYVVPEGTILGHEFSGEIVELGALAKGAFTLGQRVTALPINACGNCQRTCRLGLGIHCPSNLITGLNVNGAYAEYLRADALHVLSIPDSVSLTEGALVEPLAVGFHAADKAGLRPGANVLVIGAGPIGLSVSLFAAFNGARRVVVAELSPDRRKRALRFGASHTIDPKAGDVGAQFRDLAGGPPDVIFECVGVPGMIQKCVEMAPPFGRIVVVGVCMKPDTMVPVSAILKEVSLQFVLGYVKRDFEVVLDLLAAKRIDGLPMLTDEVSFDALPAAFEALRTPTTQCKIMLRAH